MVWNQQGDGSVNVQTRVQMMPFQARQLAQKEPEAEFDKYRVTLGKVPEFVKRNPLLARTL